MLALKHLKETGLWEAWIEFDPLGKSFGTLHVLGEIEFGSSQKLKLVPAQNSHKSKTLILRFEKLTPGKTRVKELAFSMPVKNLNDIRRIKILEGDSVFICLDEVEVLV